MSRTLSVGETAKRLDVSPDSVRNYCERGWLQCTCGRGNHHRVLLRSIESFEAQRHPKKPIQDPEPAKQRHHVDDEFEIYYLGNEGHPNDMELRYICNLSFFGAISGGSTQVPGTQK
jgi:helix-turn-helix protein